MNDTTLRSQIDSIPVSDRRDLLAYLSYGPRDREGRLAGRVRELSMEMHPAVRRWNERLAEARESGLAPWRLVWESFPALQFPITEGTAEDPDYQAAKRRGRFPARPAIPVWADEGSIEVQIIGRGPISIPVVGAGAREDFVCLWRCLGKQNRPQPIPSNQGAVYFNGLINWSELNRHLDQVRKEKGEEERSLEWRRLLAEKGGRFREALILVSSGDYSGVAAAEMDLDPGEWRRISLELRKVHEWVHHALRQARGFVSNTLTEEIVADAIALKEVVGRKGLAKLPVVLGLDRAGSLAAPGRFVHYLPGSLSKYESLVGSIALLGVEDIQANLDGEMTIEEAVSALDSWSLTRVIFPEDR